MAETSLHKYTVAEKLNKMDVDLIDVTLTTVAAAIADNEVIIIGVRKKIATASTSGNTAKPA